MNRTAAVAANLRWFRQEHFISRLVERSTFFFTGATACAYPHSFRWLIPLVIGSLVATAITALEEQ